MWKYFLNNPAGRKVGDCAVRAVSVALDISREDAYNLIADAGFKMADMPSSDSVWVQSYAAMAFTVTQSPIHAPNVIQPPIFRKTIQEGCMC